MPTKNFFLSSLLAPTHSPYYPFLYTTCKRPLSSYATGMSLNCNPSGPLTSMSLNCTTLNPFPEPSSGMMLNCRLTQTMHDMPSSHDGLLRHLGLLGILSYWMDNMPSSHLGHLGHLSHLSHLGYLGTISNLNTLDPYSLEPTPTDSPLIAFITELDPECPGLSEGYYKDDLLDPLPIDTPLLL
jgi:hypothetical protein